MICPECKKETPSVLNFCEHCKFDLTAYHKIHDENQQIKGSRLFLVSSLVSSILSFAGLVVMVIMFFNGYILTGIGGVMAYISLPIYFLVSLTGFLGTLFSKKIWKKQKRLDNRGPGRH